MENFSGKIIHTFCDVDDFCAVFIPEWQKELLEDGVRNYQRNCRMATSELITIVIAFLALISDHFFSIGFKSGLYLGDYSRMQSACLSSTIPLGYK